MSEYTTDGTLAARWFSRWVFGVLRECQRMEWAPRWLIERGPDGLPACLRWSGR